MNKGKIVRGIRNNISISIIIAICVAIVFGSYSASLTLRNSVDRLFSDINTADIIINSDDGFTAHDLELISEQTSADIVGVFHSDCRYTKGNTTASARLFSADGNVIDRDIISGENINSVGDCIAVRGKHGTEFEIGDQIYIETDAVSVHEFTVVGIADIDDPDFENSIIVSNSVFTLNSYNRLMLTCEFLRKYNTYSDRYLRAVNDIIVRLDNIAINRLDAIKAGSYDYRLLKISRYDKALAAEIEDVYSQKDELLRTNQELAIVKNYIDQNEQLIADKSEQLSISSESIYETIGAELKAHENKLNEIVKRKEILISLEIECNNLNEEYNHQVASASNVKEKMQNITNINSDEFKSLKAEYDNYVTKSEELKSKYDIKKAELDRKKIEIDVEYSKYESAYTASKENYDKLISGTDIDTQEIMQMSLMNLTARAEYNQKLEQYNIDYLQMQKSLDTVIKSVNTLYSSYAKLWYLSDRSMMFEYSHIGNITYVLDIISAIAFSASVIIVVIFTVNKLRKNLKDHMCCERKIRFSITKFKAGYLIVILPSMLGLIVGALLGLVISLAVYLISTLGMKIEFILPTVDVILLFECLVIALVSTTVGSAVAGFMPCENASKN